RLDIAFRIGEQDGSSVASGALGQARGERRLPALRRAEGFVLQVERGVVGKERELGLGPFDGRAFALHQLECKARAGDQHERDEQDRDQTAEQLGFANVLADGCAEGLETGPLDGENPPTRGTRPRHSVPLKTHSSFMRRSVAASPNRLDYWNR